MFRKWLRGSSVLVCATVLAACGGGGGGSKSSSPPNGAAGSSAVHPGFVNTSSSTPATVSGGTLHFSQFSPPLTLDPAQSGGSGAVGDIPLSAIYGVLMRYDVASGKYVPKLAQSLSSNPDFTTWTLKLRPNVKFSDGTPLNADAVVSSIKRMGKLAKVTVAPLTQLIDSYETPDAETVVFHLSQPWARFPFLLSTNGGMIVSPTAVQKYGDRYGSHPVGAGPFVLQSFTPDEQIELSRSSSYWGGKVPLSKVVFTHVASGQGTADSFNSGQVNAGMTLEPQVMSQMIKSGTPGYVFFNYGGGWQANIRPGHPTDNVKVRQAVAYAINVKQLNQRATNNTGFYSTELFPSTSRWHPDAAATQYDPDKARSLVEQVKKTTGWDGSISLTAVQTQTRQWNEALAVQAQLNAVGFKATIKPASDINQLIQTVFVRHDYDLASWVFTIWDSAPWTILFSGLGSTSSHNVIGFSNPDMDKLLEQLRVAPDVAAGKKLMGQIQQLWNAQQPLIVTESSQYYIFWNSKVHGIVPSARGNILLDKAFVS